MSEARAIRTWDSVHTWSSLVCTLFLFVLCLTGLPLIFSDEINAALSGAPPTHAKAEGKALTIEQIIAHAKALYPKDIVQFVFWDDATDGVGLGLADHPEAELEDVKRVVFDARTGAPIPETAPVSDVTSVLLSIHSSLTIGIVGELLLVLVAAAFLVSLVSGLVLYAPFLHGRPFGAIRKTNARTRWLDLHNLLGVATVAWLAIVGATGLMNALEGPLFGAWQSELMPRLLDPYKGKPFPEHPVSADAALAVAREAKPGMTPTSIGLPYSLFGSPRHYLIWLKGDTVLTENFFTPVLVDAATGELASAESLPWYLRLLEISRPLHFGDYGGLALKLIWAALDILAIIILASGVYLYAVRRRLLASEQVR